MKLLYTLLIILLISQCKADNCTNVISPTNPRDCIFQNVDSNYIRCCYFKIFAFQGGEMQKMTQCQHISQEYYDTLINRVKTQKAYIKANGGIIEEYELNCTSTYLYISLLLLMIILL